MGYEAIYKTLDIRRQKRQLTWEQLAQEIGSCTSATLKRMRNGGRTSFPDVMRIVCWLDVPARSPTKETAT